MFLDALVLALCLAADSAAGGRGPETSAPPGGALKGPARPTVSKARVTRVGVPEPLVVGQVSARELAVVSQALVTEVRKVEGIGAIGMSEIRAMLTHEYRRQMLGCQADQECLAEIAGALGVDELVSSELVVDGDTSTLAVSRIEIRTARVLSRFHGRLARRKAGEEVLGALGEVVAALYPDRALRAGEQRGVAPEAARWLNPPPLPRWAVFATAGAAVAAAGVGTVYTVTANDTTRRHNALATGGGIVSGAELARLADDADAQRRNAYVSFGVAGALAVAAAVEALFTDWHDDRAAVRVGPAGASVAVRF